MADRRIRTILDATVDGLQKGMRDASKAAKDTARDLDDLEKRAKALDRLNTKVKVEADASKADKSLSKVTDDLAKIDGEAATAKVTADSGRAEASIDSIRRTLAQLDGDGANIDIKANTSGAVDAIGADIPKAGKVAGGKAGDLLGGGLKGGMKLGLASLGGVAVAGGAAIGAALWAAIQRGMDQKASRGMFSAKTGLDEATAAKFGRAAGMAYGQAWGESVEANLDTARIALQNGLLDPDATQAATATMIGRLQMVADIMETDIPAAARAAGQMMKTGLAKDSEEAFDVIVAGFQSGVDASDDMIDTIIEYSTHFRDLGITGQEALGLIAQGMDAGAFNGDKVADALKELTIRVKDLNDEAAGDALQKLGLSHSKMADAFAEGGPRARKALDDILDGLNGIEDPSERAATAVALFGTQAEDMAGALGSLDLDTAADQLGNVAGAAENAAQRIGDNAATAIESAKRNIQLSMDGIAGILASAFDDDIAGLTRWVSENRSAVMGFAQDITGILIAAGRGIADFADLAIRGFGLAAGASAPLVEAIGGVILGIGILRNDTSLQEFGQRVADSAQGMTAFSEKADEVAEGVKSAINGAMDATEDRVMGWAGDELLAAQISDGITYATNRLSDLSAAIDSTEGTVTINGETVNAEQALDKMVTEIDNSDGTVTINGQSLPAKDAFDRMIRLINAGEGTLTIDGNNAQAKSSADAAKRYADAQTAHIKISALSGDVNAAIAAMQRRANANPIYVPVRSSGTIARANGGWIPGKAAGGWVPGPYPGKGEDNVLWPLAYGGTTLNQPLAGGEFVVNTMSSREWAPFLEAINGGLNPSDLRASAAPSGPLDLSDSTVRRLAAAMVAGAGAVADGRLEQAITSARRRSIQMTGV